MSFNFKSYVFSELHNLGGNSLDNFSSGGHHLPPMNQFNDFNGYRQQQQQQQQQQQHSNHHHHHHHPFGGGSVSSPTENHFGQLRGGGGHPHHPHSQHPLMEKSSKDWQEGLRALLPNVNVSFGALPNQSDGLHTPPTSNGRLFSSPPLNDHHHQHHHNHHERVQQRQQQHSGTCYLRSHL